LNYRKIAEHHGFNESLCRCGPDRCQFHSVAGALFRRIATTALLMMTGLNITDVATGELELALGLTRTIAVNRRPIYAVSPIHLKIQWILPRLVSDGRGQGW
jgi:hypothetical protein